jgi:hypothetical protein
MEEQFVTYEIALKLKELGFDEKCLGIYSGMQKIYCDSKTEHFTSQEKAQYIFGNDKVKCILAPLWQQVIDWFREKDIVIEIRRNFPKDQYFYTVGGKTFQHVSDSIFNYLKAREHAILKAIELWKNN